MCSSTPSVLTASELSSEECFGVGEYDSVVKRRRKCKDTFNLQTKKETEYDGELSMYERTRESRWSSDDNYDGKTTVGQPEPV